MNNPTTTDIESLKSGLYFTAATTPSVTTVERFIQDGEQKMRGILIQLGYTSEQIDELAGDEAPELQAFWFNFVSYYSMAEVWKVLPGTSGNPWRTRVEEMREELLRQPESHNVPRSEGYSFAIQTNPIQNVQFGGRFNPNLNSTDGF